MTSVPDSELNYLIAPEIKHDEFYQAIQQLVRNPDIKTVLEIGSSSGQGSTEAFVKGLRGNPSQPQLFCMEVSKPRFEALRDCYAGDPFVHCYNVSSVDLDGFPSEADVTQFYHRHPSPLNQYPLDQVLGWLRQDIEYVKTSGVAGDGIRLIKQDQGIDTFDLVLIDGSEFTGEAELEQVYGAKYLLLDDICTYKNFAAHHRLLRDPSYILLEQSASLRNGYSVFKRVEQYPVPPSPVAPEDILPIHFFTIVLNGEPFIRYHLDILKQLPFRWHWHIVEGVAALKHDTAWSVAQGGQVIDEIHRDGRSKDGTTEYLDELAQRYPEQITLYRKPLGEFWDGKREMVNVPLDHIQDSGLLWQIDVDELWTVEQICTMRQLFLDRPDKTAAYFWCTYFVGDSLVISSRHCYAQNPQQEWLRVWRYQPGMTWAAHEPPRLVQSSTNGDQEDVATIRPFTHRETERAGLVFQHFAYVTEAQLQFKESYYGYKNAVAQWQKLQTQTQFPLLLRDYFGWVNDDTLIESVDVCKIVPLMERQSETSDWRFLTAKDIQEQMMTVYKPFPQIVFDGVFFQFTNSGIAQVWRSLLQEWSQSEFAQHIIVLDRDGSAPRIAGLRYRPIPAYDYDNTATDAKMLQDICDEKGADLFISSYYTTPLSTPSVFMAYDMIPEIIGADLKQTGWREKHYGILHASSYITISESTAHDLLKFFPHILPDHVVVAHCGIKSIFQPAKPEEVNYFKQKFDITKPYFLTVGERTGVNGYKNGIAFFKALSQLVDKNEFSVVCVGGQPELEPELAALADGIPVMTVSLGDTELQAAYSGAIALVYPSLYEGFGLPVGEAMACGCPVITGRHSSIPEVGGDAAVYVDIANTHELIDALYKVQNPDLRQRLIEAGFKQCQTFSWQQMADIVANALLDTAKRLKQANTCPVSPIWEELREIQIEQQQHPTSSPSISEPQPDLQQPAQDSEVLLERIKQVRQRLNNRVNDLQQSRAQVEATQAELEQAREELETIKSSKFWKLRSLWSRL
ncbi:MAG: glycosyltransferase, partial [Cyanothece sp. SIO2G6]|nr:glycosyltransferase [Cyanothece sp. SIO2G6]